MSTTGNGTAGSGAVRFPRADYALGVCVLQRSSGRSQTSLDAGDQDAFLLEPIAAAAGTALGQFSFHRAKRIDPAIGV